MESLLMNEAMDTDAILILQATFSAVSSRAIKQTF